MTRITLSRVTDWAVLGASWQALEARADASFFQSWTWTGCLAEERFPDPILLHAEDDDRVVALALFNRRRDALGQETLFLGESGIAALDAPFIEHNGLLCESGTPDALLAVCIDAARRAPIGEQRPRRVRRVVLSGINDRLLSALIAAGQLPSQSHSRVAPYADLAALRGERRCILDAMSANARYQVRRSERAYAAQGALAVRRAETVAEARGFFTELAALHQARWTGRGQPGAFANPHFVQFHQALLTRGLPRGEVDLLRITAGDRVIGVLYNFRFRGRVLAYQSGFDYAGAERHQKPGLTCHHQALRLAAKEGQDAYDFLAGDDRYKRSLSSAEQQLHWVEFGSAWSVRRAFDRSRRLLRAGLTGAACVILPVQAGPLVGAGKAEDAPGGQMFDAALVTVARQPPDPLIVTPPMHAGGAGTSVFISREPAANVGYVPLELPRRCGLSTVSPNIRARLAIAGLAGLPNATGTVPIERFIISVNGIDAFGPNGVLPGDLIPR